MPANRIRVVAIAAVRRGDDLLIFEDHDAGGRRFHRPLGGSVEFGERAIDAVRREMREEIGAELVDCRLLGVVEDVFQDASGAPGHEVLFVFDAALADRTMYERDQVAWIDEDATWATWQPLDRYRAEPALLIPNGLLDLLDTSGPAASPTSDS